VVNFEKMKYTLLILSFLILSCNGIVRKNGLEIYRVKKEFPDFTKKPIPECYYCLELQKKDLFENPLLEESDIEFFDWKEQQIKLTEIGKIKIKELKIPLQGLPMAMVLNGELIYGFWFWNDVSSFGCDRVFTYPKLDFKLKFGHQKTYGKDPRFDGNLEKYINEKN